MSSESKNLLKTTDAYPRDSEKQPFRCDVSSRYHECTGIPGRQNTCAGVSGPDFNTPTPTPTPTPSLPSVGCSAAIADWSGPYRTDFASRRMLVSSSSGRSPEQNRGTCGSLRSASSPLPHPPSHRPHAPVRTPAGEGLPAVCFAQPPPLARRLPGDRPKSPFPDRLCCLPVPTNRSPSGGRSGLESCRDKHCLGCSQDLLALSQGC